MFVPSLGSIGLLIPGHHRDVRDAHQRRLRLEQHSSARSPVDLTMESWIYGGMSAGVIMFAMFSACSRRTTNSDCAVGSLALLFIVYHIFMVVWSIIGLKLYANFY
jgi:hypothetical protein